MKDEKNNDTKKINEIEKTTVLNIEKNLSAQIEKLQTLNTLIKNRAVFQQKKDVLLQGVEELKTDIEADNFETASYGFSFNMGKYNNDALKISNPLLIKEIALFVISKIEAKISEIENTIIKAA
ncbi:MAG: hypothetical protein WCK02_02030 [Bacteroidota bacterium]